MHWRFQYPVFGEKYRVIAWNAPGYLMSNNLKPEAPTCEDYGEAVNDFLTSLGVEKVYLVANSFGTVVGQCFAARYPQKVTKIAFTGTLIGEAWRPEEQKKAARRGQKKGYRGRQLRLWLRSGAGTRGQEHLRRETCSLAKRSPCRRPSRLHAGVALVVGTDTRPLAPKLTMPIFMFQGTEDMVAPTKEHSYVLKPLLANAKLQEVPGVGHLPEFEVPDAFNKAVLDFFAQ